MRIAAFKQNVQDWITQQWVILFGRKITSNQYEWLLGPFGEINGIGEKFVEQLAAREHLEIDKNTHAKGLIQSINQLNLTSKQGEVLSNAVIDFYENTSNYNFELKVNWNPFFKVFGVLLKILFSNRIEQLNLPLKNEKNAEGLTSEIIHLVDKQTKELKRTIWLRTFKKNNQVVYSGVYETCILPKGTNCIKAIFPLPHGNATVILEPLVRENGNLIFKSSGKRIGDSGFYFLLKDGKGGLWTKYIRSFRDTLEVSSNHKKLTAKQTLTLWNLPVVEFHYDIKKSASR